MKMAKEFVAVTQVFLVMVLALMAFENVKASEQCEGFTDEQRYYLWMAKAIGDEHDLGHTLAAIVWRESFVGQFVVKINESDGDYGSYGITHMMLSTAMSLLGYDNVWKAKEELIPKFINDDVYAMGMSLGYLKRHEYLGWRGMIARYNGAGPAAQDYMTDVVSKVAVLETCLVEF